MNSLDVKINSLKIVSFMKKQKQICASFISGFDNQKIKMLLQLQPVAYYKGAEETGSKGIEISY